MSLWKHPDPLPDYVYTAVQDGHIRILEVLPGRNDDPIVTLIHGISLDEHPYYEALSYVWGDANAQMSCIYIADSPTGNIHLERFPRAHESDTEPQEKRRVFQIAANLRRALVRLRDPEQSRRLWVDAICIDQKNLCEQSAQVGVMARIYGQAANVVAYLGPEKDGSEILPSILEKIQDHDARRQKQGQGSRNFFWDELEMPYHNLKVWEPIRSFLDRPWFRRSWIVQEALLAKDIIIYCGNWELEWNKFEDPAKLAAEFARLSGDNFGWQFPSAKGSHKLALEMISSRTAQKANHLNLIQLLDTFRFFPVTKSQDKIYSLLGVCIDKDDPAFTVDYLEPQEDTFTRYSKRFIEQGYGAKVLYCAANSHKCLNRPSWVANWDDEEFPQTRLVSATDSGYYSASSTSYLMMNLLPDSSSLQISGIIVDKIDQLSSFSPSDGHMKYRNDIYTAWTELQSLLKVENPYRGQCLHEVIWRTMICDKTGELLFKSLPPGLQSSMKWDHKKLSMEVESWHSVYGDPQRTKLYYPASEKIKRLHEEGFMRTAGQYAGGNMNTMHWKKFAASLHGYLAAVPAQSLPGDIVCVVMGADVPFVLRPRPLRGGYQLIGECYVHGLMSGEALEMTGLKTETLVLV